MNIIDMLILSSLAGGFCIGLGIGVVIGIAAYTK